MNETNKIKTNILRICKQKIFTIYFTKKNGQIRKLTGKLHFKDLENRTTIDAETGAVVIKGKNGETRIADDTWRTAGTSQKVASHFGKDMRDCISSKVDSRRNR